MNQVIDVDPRTLFARLAHDLPSEVRSHVFVVGSLAAACHHATRIEGGRVKTKDADLVIHPASATEPAVAVATRLRALGWRHKPTALTPGTSHTPVDALPAIRLYPPDHEDYFVEILIVPEGEHPGVKPWVRVELDEGWYGLPSFEFLALTAIDRQRSDAGLEYAHPSMMSLANLLSHSELGTHVMSTPAGGLDIHRSSKDLGRVLALAWLETREETERWAQRWQHGLAVCFPTRWPQLGARLGDGLRALLADAVRLQEAWHCCAYGLLASKGVTREQLEFTALQLLADAIAPVEVAARARVIT